MIRQARIYVCEACAAGYARAGVCTNCGVKTKLLQGHKYHARSVQHDGQRFDSQKECDQYKILKAIEKAGHIRDLRTQVPFRCKVEGVHICIYYADFVYYDVVSQETIVVDAKGYRTPEYKLKKKLVEAIHKITIQEV